MGKLENLMNFQICSTQPKHPQGRVKKASQKSSIMILNSERSDNGHIFDFDFFCNYDVFFLRTKIALIFTV